MYNFEYFDYILYIIIVFYHPSDNNNIDIIFIFLLKSLIITYFTLKKNKTKYINEIFYSFVVFGYLTTHGIMSGLDILFDKNNEIIFVFIVKCSIFTYIIFITFDGLWWFYWFDENELIKFIY
jgi:hypothetical protein